MSIPDQLAYLFILAVPIACIAWTITHEEVFREPREWCKNKSEKCNRLFKRKFFYLFTCEYCFSHYVTIVLLIITRFKLLYADWPPSCVPHCSVVLCDGLNTVLALQELAAQLGEARPS